MAFFNPTSDMCSVQLKTFNINRNMKLKEEFAKSRKLFFDWKHSRLSKNSDPRIEQAAERLEVLWNKASLTQSCLNYFFSMKAHHERLSNGYAGDDLWDKYSEQAMLFRVDLVHRITIKLFK
jgi:hypothetical protein